PEVSDNPEAQQLRDEEASDRSAQTQEETLAPTKDDDFNWESYVEEFNSTPSTLPAMREINEELPSFENALTKTTTLEEHLMWQLSMLSLTEQEQKLGQLIIGNL